jgi:hypothetical protein
MLLPASCFCQLREKRLFDNEKLGTQPGKSQQSCGIETRGSSLGCRKRKPLRACSHQSGSVTIPKVDVRFTPKPPQSLRGTQMTRWANKRHRLFFAQRQRPSEPFRGAVCNRSCTCCFQNFAKNVVI